MAELPIENARYDVVCPHCHKQFEAEPLVGSAGRYTGFKCPHCRLFVAYERLEEQDAVERAE